MQKNNKTVVFQIISSVLKLLVIAIIIFALFFLIPPTCKHDFKTYPEKGYCEFNLKTCEGLFGCKKYENLQVPCGSVLTLCGEKVFCGCGDNKEPLSYSAGEIEVIKESRPFSYSSEQLKKMSNECGAGYDIAYFDRLISKFSNSIETVYNFKYQGSDQDSRAFVVTLLHNEAEYLSLEEFKKDFDLCAAGGYLYPAQLNKDWLLFVNSCGSGSVSNSSCDEVKKIVEPSLKLN